MTAGQARARWTLWGSVAVLSLAVALGAVAYARQVLHGDITTSMRTLGSGGGAVWGLYIALDGFCLGAGVALMACACLARFSRDRDMEAVARIAMPAALTCFLAAALSVMADQGRPLAALWYLGTVGRPQSPLFATSTTVGAICLVGSLVHCVLARRPDLAVYAARPSFWRPLQHLLAAGYRGSAGQWHRRRQVGVWMSLFMLVALTVPLVALALAYSRRPGRPAFVAAGEAVAFALCAAVAGLSVLAIAAGLVGRLGGATSGLRARGFARLGLGFLLVDAIAAFTVVASTVAASCSGDAATVGWAEAVAGRAYGLLFWSQMVLFVAPASALLWLALRGHLRPRPVIICGVLSGVGAFLHSYVALVSWQTHGLPLPYPHGSYAPSLTELAVVGGIVALSLLLLLPSTRLIPFAPVAQEQAPAEPPAVDRPRMVLTLAWLAIGVALAAAGLVLSLRVGAEPSADPIVPGSPVVFVAGLMMLVTTGAVYELYPERAASTSAVSDACAAARAGEPRRA